MTEEEYRKRYKEICARFDADIDELKTEYLKSIFPYKVGDIVEDNLGKGEIIGMNKEFYASLNNRIPCYHVKLKTLKKDGTPMKVKRVRWTESFHIKIK